MNHKMAPLIAIIEITIPGTKLQDPADKLYIECEGFISLAV